MKKSNPFRHLAAAAFACLLAASCGDLMTDGGTALPPGKYPMTFTATVEGLTATRATTDNAWEGNEEVAVQVAGEVKKYTAARDGKLTAIGGVTPFYWTSSIEQKTLSAWHSATYSATQPTSFTVQADQSGGGYRQSDLIYAPATTISYRNPALRFNHLPVKVVVNLKNGDGVTANAVQNATVSIVNQQLTSGTIAGDWSVAQQSAVGYNIIYANDLCSVAGGYQKSVQALLVPQKVDAPGKFIKVTIAGQEFYYSTATDFAAGKQYTFNITVNKTGLTVTVNDAEAWTGITTNVTSREVTSYTASDLKIGDYYYSDGTWSDGGLRKQYADGTIVKEDVAPVLSGGRTVIGIVYSTDVSRIGTAAANVLSGKSVTPHGLVMALTNASERCVWGEFDRDENSGSNSGEPFYDNTDQLTKQYNNIDGYGETRWMLNKITGGYSGETYKAFYVVSLYGTWTTTPYAAPLANTTGWFIPSMGQWWDILSNLGGIDLRAYRNNTNDNIEISGGIAQTAVDNMNRCLNKIGGIPAFTLNTQFWSSSEYSGSYACSVNFNRNGFLGLSRHDKRSAFKVRCSLAF